MWDSAPASSPAASKPPLTPPPPPIWNDCGLDEARLRLASGQDGVARIAHAVGFSSDDAFRRAFERRFGVTPSAYRGRFAAPPSPKDEDHEAVCHL